MTFTYNETLSHANYFLHRERVELVRKGLAEAQGKRVLELGNMAWYGYLEQKGIIPETTVAINISEAELDKGRELAINSEIQPQFYLMDAHKLAFPDNSFDVVFGAAILHHLEHEVILKEIHRVLKPDGFIFFLEPLDNNPVGKLIRLCTPEARTDDEQPWRFREIKIFKKYFSFEDLTYQGLFSVPIGVVSRLLFRKNPENALNRFGFALDKGFLKIMPFAGPIYRQIVFKARPRVKT